MRRGVVDGVAATAATTAVLGAGERLGAAVEQPPEQVVEEATRKVGTAPPGPPVEGVLVRTALFAVGAAMGAVFRLRPGPPPTGCRTRRVRCRVGVDALTETLDGMAEVAGASTPPLAPDTAPRRLAEILTGVGERP